MRKNTPVLMDCSANLLRSLCLLISAGLLATGPVSAQPPREEAKPSPYLEENNQIRRDKFDVILPQIMREQGIDMWIHVVRREIPDPFGADELGSTSGVFVFTDRGGDRIERAVLGRRWGAAQREWVASDYIDPIKALDAYDIVSDPIRIQEPVSGPVTEYDLRFKGLREFVKARNPKRIAVNFKQTLSQWPTYHAGSDGVSHTDYLLLTEELGKKYARRIVSSENLVMDYSIRKVPSEIRLLKKIRREDIERGKRVFAQIVPGETRAPYATVLLEDVYTVVHRRMSTGLSQRGRSSGWDDAVVQRGDILAQPITGMYAYVLRQGETEPPPEIKRLWAEYLKVDRILAQTIRVGLTPREIIKNYTKRFEEEGIILRDDQLHMVLPKNDFTAYSKGFDPTKTHLTIDSHGQMKGARPRSDETYYSPRIGSYGPDWVKDKPLAPNHHFVLEYFFYMPSPAEKGKDQYLLWWDHEEAIATENGVEYLSPPQKELFLIR